MMKPHYVKARKRHGSRCLDLTIPADVQEECEIVAGDYFDLIVEKERVDGKEKLVLKYVKVSSANKTSE
jgi:hypothetical protein